MNTNLFINIYWYYMLLFWNFFNKVSKEFDALLIDPDAEDSPFDCFDNDTLEVGIWPLKGDTIPVILYSSFIHCYQILRLTPDGSVLFCFNKRPNKIKDSKLLLNATCVKPVIIVYYFWRKKCKVIVFDQVWSSLMV